MKGGGASAAAVGGLAVGIAFVVLFSFFSPGLASYSKAAYTLESRGEGETSGKMVFAGTLEGKTLQIYVVNTDGTGLANLTNDDRWNISPVVSPDGTRIAYASSRNPYGSDEPPGTSIHVIDADGGNKLQLTEPGNSLGRFVWSLDGTRIAYEVGVERDGEIFLVKADGTGRPTNITNDKESNDFKPTWASDNRIIFESVKSDESRRRFTESSFKQVDIDSGDVKKLFDFDYDTSGSHVWSPDLDLVAYRHFDDDLSPSNLYVMNAQGGEQTQLTFEEQVLEASRYGRLMAAKWSSTAARSLSS